MIKSPEALRRFERDGNRLYKGSSSGPSTTTVTNSTSLPGYAQPYATQLMQRAASLSNKPYESYSGQRIADLNQNQLAGINGLSNSYAGNQATLGSYQNMMNKTLNGDYLNLSTNPYWQAQSDAITTAYNKGVKPSTDAAFARAGAFGGSAYNDQVQNNQASLGSSLSNLAGNIYNTERGYQNSVNPSALFSAQQGAAQNVIGAGDITRSFTQDLLNMAYGDWQSAQNYPYSQLDVLAKGLSGAVGNASNSFQTAPNPYQANNFANYLGGGLAGMGLLSALGGQS